MLDFRNLVDVLQADRAHRSQCRIAVRRTTCTRLPLLAVVVVHRPRYIARATDLALGWRNTSSRQEEGCRGRRAQLEVEGAVWSDGDACGYRGAGVVVCCARIELLYVRELGCGYAVGWDGIVTLQKSMLFTPLLPSAGPTGGDGDAWPAPTISLTIWSFCIAFLAIVGCVWWLYSCVYGSFGGPQWSGRKVFPGRLWSDDGLRQCPLVHPGANYSLFSGLAFLVWPQRVDLGRWSRGSCGCKPRDSAIAKMRDATAAFRHPPVPVNIPTRRPLLLVFAPQPHNVCPDAYRCTIED